MLLLLIILLLGRQITVGICVILKRHDQLNWKQLLTLFIRYRSLLQNNKRKKRTTDLFFSNYNINNNNKNKNVQFLKKTEIMGYNNMKWKKERKKDRLIIINNKMNRKQLNWQPKSCPRLIP